jgi:hypothetical protein
MKTQICDTINPTTLPSSFTFGIRGGRTAKRLLSSDNSFLMFQTIKIAYYLLILTPPSAQTLCCALSPVRVFPRLIWLDSPNAPIQRHSSPHRIRMAFLRNQFGN